MEKLLLNDTVAPFGVENSGKDTKGGITYLKVILRPDDKNHEFIKSRVEYFEDVESRKMGKYEIVSSIRPLKDGTDLLRLRIKNYKGRRLVKMLFAPTCDKDDYLRSVDDLYLYSKINVKFGVGDGYIFQADGTSKFGLNLYVDEVTIM